jgi:hypothetical protein
MNAIHRSQLSQRKVEIFVSSCIHSVDRKSSLKQLFVNAPGTTRKIAGRTSQPDATLIDRKTKRDRQMS